MRAEEAEKILIDFDWVFVDAEKGKWHFSKGIKRAVINTGEQEFQSKPGIHTSVSMLHVDGIVINERNLTLTINLPYCDESMILEGVEKLDADLRT